MSIVNIKRIYDEPSINDGLRILVDRVWPRGISKEKAKIDLWLKDLAPTKDLRKWFNHDPAKFIEFKRKYRKEMETDHKEGLEDIVRLAIEQKVTLLYGSRNTRYNQAVVLRQVLKEKLSGQC